MPTRIAEEIRVAAFGEGEIGASFGLAVSYDRDGEALMAAADRELLAAKNRLYGRASGLTARR